MAKKAGTFVSDWTSTQALRFAGDVLNLINHDGEWPSPECEPGPQAARAAAMQEAIKSLAFAVRELNDEIQLIRATVSVKVDRYQVREVSKSPAVYQVVDTRGDRVVQESQGRGAKARSIRGARSANQQQKISDHQANRKIRP